MKKIEMDKLLALTEAWTDCALRTDNVHRARLYAECKRDLLDLLDTLEVDRPSAEEIREKLGWKKHSNKDPLGGHDPL